jgi:hypothetical protein
MKRTSYGHTSRRIRICGQCHGWFVSDGTHRRFCTPCWAVARRTTELPWVLRPIDTTLNYDTPVTVGKYAAG